MATLVVNIPDDKVAFFKKLVAELGFGEAVKSKTAKPVVATVTKKPRTKIEQDFVDGYREMVEADNGTGPPLQDARSFVEELRKEEELRNAKKQAKPRQRTHA